ncbi:PleD family two-component system response regulator [Desulfonatronospira sp. MSAO_Bac3]|uniref:PleD family two-component system response regulator n=1 Tax=Desulfonatronospira sp. MSAO_Bac3 TaxID=2293857 RepID=UPI000FF4CD62|nr:PleD family two-component system response regulator [Desulfonatronospira sp. MSAO_Bac3]RQD74838.1 MAG: PleD family two-component system response regulator [Desulfonatronospira sp. MSAO_Bac3]
MSSDEKKEKRSVLIVDDQPDNIHALGKLIKDEYRIMAATSGARALEIAESDNPPDLILLDVMMPEMDGYEVCRRLKRNEKTNSIPVIFVTAMDSAEDEETGFNLGAVDYISKPFKPTIVRARVKNQMNLKIKTDMLEKLSMQDGLTEIPNRRFFEENLAREWSRCMRNGLPLSLLIMDIDNFKPYNDNYGHGAGDDCLKKVANVIKNTLSRPTDLAARYGGEEFVVLLPETHAAGALHVAEELRAAVQGLGITHEHSPTASVVTISVGTSTHSAESPMKNKEQLLQLADEALYQAKESGRNRVQSSYLDW